MFQPRVIGNNLPVKVIEKIIINLDVPELKTLAQVSRQFNRISSPLLYASIYLPHRRSVEALRRTLKRRPEKILWIKHIIVGTPLANDRKALKTLSNLLTKLQGLNGFEITGKETPLDQLRNVIDSLNTPSLRRLSIYTQEQPIGELVTDIIARHPTLGVFHLSPGANITSMKGTMSLPYLTEFVGPPGCLHHEMMKLPLRSVSIAWEQGTTLSEISKDIKNVARCCAETIESFACFKPGSFVAILQHIKTYLPKIRHLEVSGISIESQQVVDLLIKQLNTLKLLRSFELHPVIPKYASIEIELRSILNGVKTLTELTCDGITYKKEEKKIKIKVEE
ncbi:hypothetical protein ONZ45_g11489 [Pleurotus djamor]|nr:hypothetical protein ONZ45_g11489 [Pleurotus djamor]